MRVFSKSSHGPDTVLFARRGAKGMATGSRPNGTLGIAKPHWVWAFASIGSLILLAVSSRGQVQIQPFPLPPGGIPRDPSGEPVVELPRDPDTKRRLEAALDYIKSKDWPQATSILQSLIDTREDVFIRMTPELSKLAAEAVPGMKAGSLDMSVRALANSLVARLPKDALDLYQTAQEPKARGLLKEARERQP